MTVLGTRVRPYTAMKGLDLAMELETRVPTMQSGKHRQADRDGPASLL